MSTTAMVHGHPLLFLSHILCLYLQIHNHCCSQALSFCLFYDAVSCKPCTVPLCRGLIKIACDIKISLIRYLHVQLSFVRHPYRKQPTPTTAATISMLV